MNNLIDLLQYKIPEIESLSQFDDFLELRNQLSLLIKNIENNWPERYAKEISALRSISADLDQLGPKSKKRSLKEFIFARNKTLSILNELLEMED